MSDRECDMDMNLEDSRISILVYGYGNPERQDDGLGRSIVSMIEQASIPGVDTEYNNVLRKSDAQVIGSYDIVIFTEAAMFDEPPFVFHKIDPSSDIFDAEHAMAPESVLAICYETGTMCPTTYILGIRGYEWEFKEGLTNGAKSNLDAAYMFISVLLHRGSLLAFDKASQGYGLLADVQ